MSPIILSSQLHKENLLTECSLCLSTLSRSNFECDLGHLMCDFCLRIFKHCAVCQDDHLGDQKIWEKTPPLRFHRAHRGTLVHISNDRVRATVTGSDLSPGHSLAYIFFDRPVQSDEKVLISVSMGGQKFGGFFMAGFTNEDPTFVKNLPKLLNGSCCLKIRPKKNKKSVVVSFSVNGSNGKMWAEIGGQQIALAEEPIIISTKNVVDTSKPIWAFVRLFHKNDQIVIIT